MGQGGRRESFVYFSLEERCLPIRVRELPRLTLTLIGTRRLTPIPDPRCVVKQVDPEQFGILMEILPAYVSYLKARLSAPKLPISSLVTPSLVRSESYTERLSRKPDCPKP